jgi:hypothetical protein
MKPKAPKRGDDQATLTISLSKLLKARIEAAAASETRSVSNWCVYHLEKLLRQPVDVSGDAAQPTAKSNQAKAPPAA